ATERALATEFRASIEGTVIDHFDLVTEGWNPAGGSVDQSHGDLLTEVEDILRADGVKPEDVELVMCTCAGDEALTDFVDRVHQPPAGAKRAALVRKLTGVRRELLRRLHARFVGARRAA